MFFDILSGATDLAGPVLIDGENCYERYEDSHEADNEKELTGLCVVLSRFTTPWLSSCTNNAIRAR